MDKFYIHKGFRIHKDEVGQYKLGRGLAQFFIEETKTLNDSTKSLPVTRLERVYFFTAHEARKYIDTFFKNKISFRIN